MVRALLAGTKTQTRRLVKSIELARGEARGVRVAPNTFCYLDFDGVPGLSWRPFGGSPTVPYPPEKIVAACPHGRPGDRLWVRETWGLHLYGDFTCWCRDSVVGRSRDDLLASWELAYAADATSPYDHWRPNIHMPRWASRITLEVTGVRVERLQAINEADAKAEGVKPFFEEYAGIGPEQRITSGERAADAPFRASYAVLWDTINGADSWTANPWVWVVEFKRETP